MDRAEEARMLREAAEQITRVGLGEWMHAPAGSLALGQQRILEIARALCSDPCLLLLDEPAAGLRLKEKEAFGRVAEATEIGRHGGVDCRTRHGLRDESG